MNGWTDLDTINVYLDLSMRDVEDKDLFVHELKSKEEILRPISKPRQCPNCGEVLANQDFEKFLTDRKFMEQFVNHPTFQEALRKALNSGN